MSKRSGEQSRRSFIQAQRSQPARYRKMMAARDKLRLVNALRAAANRLEAEAKGSYDFLNSPAASGARGVAVTDHAVCRFLERVMGIDVDAIRDQIARLVPDSRVPAGKGATTHGIHIRDGFQFLLSPNSIVSVLAPEMDASGWLSSDELAHLEEAAS
jgi:hypothetical protein